MLWQLDGMHDIWRWHLNNKALLKLWSLMDIFVFLAHFAPSRRFNSVQFRISWRIFAWRLTNIVALRPVSRTYGEHDFIYKGYYSHVNGTRGLLCEATPPYVCTIPARNDSLNASRCVRVRWYYAILHLVVYRFEMCKKYFYYCRKYLF